MNKSVKTNYKTIENNQNGRNILIKKETTLGSLFIPTSININNTNNYNDNVVSNNGINDNINNVKDIENGNVITNEYIGQELSRIEKYENTILEKSVRTSVKLLVIDTRTNKVIKEIEDHNETTLYGDLYWGNDNNLKIALITNQTISEDFLNELSNNVIVAIQPNIKDKIFSSNLYEQNVTLDSSNNRYYVNIQYTNNTGQDIILYGFGTYDSNKNVIRSIYLFDSPIILENGYMLIGRYEIHYVNQSLINNNNINTSNTAPEQSISIPKLLDATEFNHNDFRKYILDYFYPLFISKDVKQQIFNFKLGKHFPTKQMAKIVNPDNIAGTYTDYKLQISVNDENFKEYGLVTPIKKVGAVNYEYDNFILFYKITNSGGLSEAKAKRYIVALNNTNFWMHNNFGLLWVLPKYKFYEK